MNADVTGVAEDEALEFEDCRLPLKPIKTADNSREWMFADHSWKQKEVTISL